MINYYYLKHYKFEKNIKILILPMLLLISKIAKLYLTYFTSRTFFIFIICDKFYFLFLAAAATFLIWFARFIFIIYYFYWTVIFRSRLLLFMFYKFLSLFIKEIKINVFSFVPESSENEALFDLIKLEFIFWKFLFELISSFIYFFTLVLIL